MDHREAGHDQDVRIQLLEGETRAVRTNEIVILGFQDDYKTWSPSQNDDSRNYIPCVLGQQVTYQRRMPHANCYNGENFDSPISMMPCGCDIYDYEW
jgi:hypothetical protein